MVKSEKFGYLHLVYHFTAPLRGTKYSRMGQVKFVEDTLADLPKRKICLSRPYHFKFFKGCSNLFFLLLLFDQKLMSIPKIIYIIVFLMNASTKKSTTLS